jgi:hypothetical protein
VAAGVTDEEYNDPCCGCGCEDDIECEECFEALIRSEVEPAVCSAALKKSSKLEILFVKTYVGLRLMMVNRGGR